MDQWIAEGVENDEGNWEKRKEDPLIKVWNRFEGSEFNKNCPIIRCEHYFPDIDDPNQIFEGLIKYRQEWDSANDVVEEIPEFTNKNTMIHRIVVKSVVGT